MSTVESGKQITNSIEKVGSISFAKTLSERRKLTKGTLHTGNTKIALAILCARNAKPFLSMSALSMTVKSEPDATPRKARFSTEPK